MSLCLAKQKAGAPLEYQVASAGGSGMLGVSDFFQSQLRDAVTVTAAAVNQCRSCRTCSAQVRAGRPTTSEEEDGGVEASIRRGGPSAAAA